MAVGDKGIGPLLGLGGKPKPEKATDDDAGSSAGSALADAIKSGDGKSIYDAFKLLKEACEMPAPTESDDESENSDEMGA